MSDLVRRPSQFAAQPGAGFGSLAQRRSYRELARRVTEAEADGVVAAARVRAAAFATHTALSEVATLSNMEAQLLKLCPLGADRYQAIVDTFTGVAAAELMRLSR